VAGCSGHLVHTPWVTSDPGRRWLPDCPRESAPDHLYMRRDACLGEAKTCCPGRSSWPDDDRVLLCRFGFPPSGCASGCKRSYGAAPGRRHRAWRNCRWRALRRGVARGRTGAVIDRRTRLTSGTRKSRRSPAMRTATTGWSTTTFLSAPRAFDPRGALSDDETRRRAHHGEDAMVAAQRHRRNTGGTEPVLTA